MEEVWKHLTEEGLEDYIISNTGKVKLLARDVPTHIVNRGRDMIVTAHRKEKELVPNYEGNRPIIRLRKTDGTRVKKSLPLLVLSVFNPRPEFEDHNKYTAAYIDGDYTNNRLDNLVYIAKSDLMKSISSTTKGEPKPWLAKYKHYLIKVNDKIVGYFTDTYDAAAKFNSYGFHTSPSAIARVLHDETLFYHIFKFEQVSEEEYDNISKKTTMSDLKAIYDIVIKERMIAKKPVYKQAVKKEIVYKEKIVYKDRIKEPKSIIIKIHDSKLYITLIANTVNLGGHIYEKDKKETQNECNDILSNRKSTNIKEKKTATKETTPKHKSVKEIKQDMFKRELMKRLGGKYEG